MKSIWNNERLQRLFERYNRLYWRGRLSGYCITAASLEGRVGVCHLRAHRIEIDPVQHSSDRELRGTVLHEMAHAASNDGHSIRFFAQVERLLERRAPIKISVAEGGQVKIVANLVPARFPLLKRRMDRIGAQEATELERFIAAKKIPTHTTSSEEIIAQFREPDLAAYTWKYALLAVGKEYATIDETGRPLTAWARRVLAKCKRAHRNARRDHLEYEKRKKALFGESTESKYPLESAPQTKRSISSLHSALG